jgi:hypothetical protein
MEFVMPGLAPFAKASPVLGIGPPKPWRRRKPGHDEKRLIFKGFERARKCWMVFWTDSQDDGDRTRAPLIYSATIIPSLAVV